MHYFKTALMGIFLLSSAGIQAADESGNFVYKGAGITSCSDFVSARKQGGNTYFMYGGWIEGFISGANLYEQATYDLLPWQNTDLLAASLAKYCTSQPDEPFHRAVTRMMQSLYAQRLQSSSPIVVLKSDENSVAVYKEVIVRMQKRLTEKGHYTGESHGVFDQATRDAVLAFQAARGIQATGLPDMVTLVHLMSGSD